MLARLVNFCYTYDEDLSVSFTLHVANPSWSSLDERIFNSYFSIEVDGKIEGILGLNACSQKWHIVQLTTTVGCYRKRRNGCKCIETNLGCSKNGLFSQKSHDHSIRIPNFF